ncbi:hypothetical protein CLV98_102516 [Dyadobacter jejuensis]|uniref:Acetyltransferase (GNAT) family protein n=1 Tax=Dyadobacter jejuensis TaxID=1082580 RepID=A0A316AQE2_9BACT|nr:GNAT family N-acetyltransferase [Dyadobacter jejuensis]PWJ59681.1 hypothetical protein CLV98_102516 [Dyadobacter jejuensis]
MKKELPHLHFAGRTGQEIESLVPGLAQLRIGVFKDYPYLYDGDLDYEQEYLKIYSRCPRSFVFAAYDGTHMVGATTCIPLADETAEVQKPFLEAGYDVHSIFYFGESLLLPQYRGLGIGHRFFDEREAHAASFGSYTHTSFCSVDRGHSHPAKPADYRSNNAFWLKRQYTELPDLQCTMSWLDIGQEQETEKQMIFWIKDI